VQDGVTGAAVARRIPRIVAEREHGVLWDGDVGLELVGVEPAVRVVVEGDAKFLRERDAEGEDAERG
jgi:hypothetical protein